MTTQSLVIDNTSRLQLASEVDYILLDGSGSMMDKWLETMAALKVYGDALAAESIKSRILLRQFGSRVNPHYSFEGPVSEFNPLSIRACGGMTALYDGIHIMSRDMRDLNPSKAAICIVTDGEENSSDFTTLAQASALLNWCRAKGWQVVFIGADFSNAEQARALGVDNSQAIGVAQALLSDAAAELAKKRTRYSRTGAPMHWSESEQRQFGGYLSSK